MTKMTWTCHATGPSEREAGAACALGPDAWAERLRLDRERAASNQSAELAAITEVAIERARDAGAAAMVLSGSTARGRRTRVSDVDYHVIGATSLRLTDLPTDIDLYADDVDRFWAKLRKGDDFAHWSVWYGCVLFDSGVLREATTYVAERDAWPDPDRKLRQARDALDFADKIAGSGDYGATLEQTRGALSLVARWVLLSSDVFPLARDELAEQMEQLGQAKLAADLRRSIRERPSLDDLRNALIQARGITDASVAAAA